MYYWGAEQGGRRYLRSVMLFLVCLSETSQLLNLLHRVRGGGHV